VQHCCLAVQLIDCACCFMVLNDCWEQINHIHIHIIFVRNVVRKLWLWCRCSVSWLGEKLSLVGRRIIHVLCTCSVPEEGAVRGECIRHFRSSALRREICDKRSDVVDWTNLQVIDDRHNTAHRQLRHCAIRVLFLKLTGLAFSEVIRL